MSEKDLQQWVWGQEISNTDCLGIWQLTFIWKRLLLSNPWLQTFNHLSEMLSNIAPVLCYIQFGKFKWAIKANLTPFELNKRGKIVRLLLLWLNMALAFLDSFCCHASSSIWLIVPFTLRKTHKISVESARNAIAFGGRRLIAAKNSQNIMQS